MQTSAPTPEELENRALRAVDALGLFSRPLKNGKLRPDETDLVFAGHSMAIFEHLVHELCHAALLGIEPSEHTASDVSAALDAVPGYAAMMQEAMTFAVEMHVLIHYGIVIDDHEYEATKKLGEDVSHFLTKGDLYVASTVQGCDADTVSHLAHTGFSIQDVARIVIDWIDRKGFPGSMLEDR